MQYRQYGKDGPQVSTLGFGVMRLPPRKNRGWGSVNFTKAAAVMRAAMEAGVNIFDSHHNYHNGLSEEAIGRALKGWRGQRIVIQTKTPFYKDEPLDYFKRLVEQALAKTGVSRIDYLLFHSLRLEMFKKRGRAFLKLTDWAIKRGFIGGRGFSSHDTPENVKALIDTGEFSAMVVSFNWLNQKMADTLAHGAGRGMGVAVMNPVMGGNLAVKTPQILRLLPGAKTAPEVAFRFVLSTPGVATALSGMNDLRQVRENARLADLQPPLTAPQRRAMLDRLEKVQSRSIVCSACGYCMPCTHGVDIPNNFLHLGRAEMFGLADLAKSGFRRLRKSKEGDKSALACERCGQCLPKCPNRIQIVKQLQRTATLLAE
jgi:uncharacterized protein